MLKKMIRFVFNEFGYQIQPKHSSGMAAIKNDETFTMRSALRRCRERGMEFNTVLDVGASDGRWSAECMKVFPEANYVLIEAQNVHKSSLEEFKNLHPKVDFILAAAGEERGEIFFDSSDPFGGVASLSKKDENYTKVPVVALDEVIENESYKEPYLLKLDTHGFELPILKGAGKIIENAGLIIIETYNFRLTQDSPRYWEMCAYMDKLGFAPIENIDLMLRERDKAFWQMDTFFLPKGNPVFLNNSYS